MSAPPAPTAPTRLTLPALGEPARARARFWDRMARRYAAHAIADQAGYEATLARVRTLLQPQHVVLEIGCGTGSTALRLADAVQSLLATDSSAGMIAIAREKQAALAQPLPGLRFELADAEAAWAPPASCDAILAFNVLHLMVDLDAAIAAGKAALVPGGLFISKTPCLGEMNPLVPRLLLPALRLLRIAPPVRALDEALLRAAFARHGLQVEAVERHGRKGRDVRPFIVARKPA